MSGQLMGRPKADPLVKRSRLLGAKFTEAEGEAWDKLRSMLGGGGTLKPRDTDVLRLMVAECCMVRGIAWPGPEAAQVVLPRLYPLPPEPTVLRVAEPTELTYGTQAAAEQPPAAGDRVVEFDVEAPPPAPAGKAKRRR